MPVTHTNRKAKTYYLHQGTTKTGNPKYFFALRDEGELVETIPPGYEIYENPNAQVFLRRKWPPSKSACSNIAVCNTSSSMPGRTPSSSTRRIRMLIC